MNRSLYLLYHDICEPNSISGFATPGASQYKIRPEQFTRHIQLFTPSSAVNPVFTFDDGGSSMMRAADLLERHHLRGLFFVSTRFTNSCGFLSNTEITDLFSRGHVIGSHSHSHTIPMTGLSRRAALLDWEQSKAFLEQLIGAPVVDAAIPGGVTSIRMIKDLRNLGFSRVFLSSPHPIHGLFLRSVVFGRFSVDSRTTIKSLRRISDGDLGPLYLQSSGRFFTDVGRAVLGRLWYRLRDRARAVEVQ